MRLEVSGSRKAGFERLNAAELGIAFTNKLSRDRAITNRTLLNGSGVAAGDVDGDGLCDLYFCGLESGNALYRNLGGWRFADITASAGVACGDQDSTGAVFADIDGDGDLDLLVTGVGRGVRVFVNDGRGRFRETTAASGLASSTGSTSIALADVDGDGDLDVYVANYRSDTIADEPNISFRLQNVDGKPVVTHVRNQPVTAPAWTNRFEVLPNGEVMELGEVDVLALNDGNGVFSPVPFTGGAFLDEDGKPLSAPPREWGLAAQFHDFTGDGAPDLYVCNDFTGPDRIWVNLGDGRFQAIGRTAVRTISAFSMGVDFADIDRDGHVDMFIVDMLSPDARKQHMQLGGRMAMAWPMGQIENRPQAIRNTLQRNRGDGTFAETSHFAGVEASDWSWTPIFLDVDLDGLEDILVSNGQMRDFQNVDHMERIEALRRGRRTTQADVFQWMREVPQLLTANVAFRNLGGGRFEPAGAAWGFDHVGISQGMALADLDGDGDLDVIVNNLEAGPGLYRNESAAPRIAVRLKGRGANPAGVGSRVILRDARGEQSQEIICGGRYLSGDQMMRVFAAREGGATLVVQWRSGRESKAAVEPNFLYEIHEPAEGGSPPPPAARPKPLFEPFVIPAGAVHAESTFDERFRQPLISRYLAQLGPGVLWHDFNGDGWEDLALGCGKGGAPIVLHNQQGRAFTLADLPALKRPVAGDLTGLVAARGVIMAGISSYEDDEWSGGLIRIYDLQRGVSGDSLLGHAWSAGPIALADIDADGDLDLFVGGRVTPGKYPLATESILFANEGGRFQPAQKWEDFGLVSGAVFSDLDQDGWAELVVAPEWGPIRVFQRVEGRYVERTEELELSGTQGWWHGVATGDLDGDGLLEIVATNWGLNSRFRASPERPQRLYYGDFNGDGVVDLVEARFDPDLGKETPTRTWDVARHALPFLAARVPSFEAYGRMSVQEIYGEALRDARVCEANTLESMVFMGRGGRYTARPLPQEAQWSSAWGAVIADFDGDGAEDVALSQNFFAMAPGESRCDAGRGLLLRGDGRGGLAPMPGIASGIEVYGDQRGCAAADFDRDGRLDLAIAQNANALRVFRNVGAKPGLRVRLRGPVGNPEGVGASVWLTRGGWRGPVREAQAGSGYWSQNGSTLVLALPAERAGLRAHVRWPGGREFSADVPAECSAIEIDSRGALRVLP